MKKNRIDRVINILTALGTGKTFTVDSLANLFGLSRRTIFRDLTELGKMGIPCRHNTKTGEYSIGPDFFMPPANFDVREALTLLLLTYNAKNLIHLPIGNSASLAALKIENHLPDTTRQHCDSVLKKMSIHVGPRVVQNCQTEIFTALQTALAEKRIIRICYRSPHDNLVTDLNPYHLRYSNFVWRVFGRSSFHRDLRCFQLNYISELVLLDSYFTDGEDFNINDYIGRAWATKPGGELYDIKLRFSPQIAPSVAYVQWHSTQRVTFNKDDSVQMEFNVDGLDEILQWILSYGDQVHVIAPKILQDKITGIAQNTARLYDQPQEYVRELAAQTGLL